MSMAIRDEEAVLKLKELSVWAFTCMQMEMEMDNFFRCVDDNRHAKVHPFLSRTGFNHLKGFGYKICRVTGKITLKKAAHYRTILFPLSIGAGSRSIGSGELMTDFGVLKPGHWAEINSVFVVDALMDCLIVLLPELALPMAQTQSEYTVRY
ncbi:unnamed protein product [Penicillium nalgiovense]|uniref:Uncharacterized protein n=1 Tax=Penicillium nalgiovense TaxID=60175 RepID=A0A9W4IU39_PENNA|nr:unnamed protein product [Penicillium nalgiovense]CAG7949903.1 unnamed protein product [Penicillium nalgiovense]CAG7967083.1 unnamed protein product [Penicillium nalgiovense]CAG7984974.1 unnamed protein product [Penicillium nalgiovense]CAG8000094.1 unnamed protein product [Penicillium nalgiovense]